MYLWTWWTWAFHLFLADAACLPDALPAAGPRIRLLSYDWPSARLVTLITKILLEEALGYTPLLNDRAALSIQDAVVSLTGCGNLTCEDPMGAAPADVALESWLGAYGAYYQEFTQQHPGRLLDLGSMGYKGEEALFMRKATVDAAFEETGRNLEYHRSYNTSHFQAKGFFDSLHDLNVSQFKLCNDSRTMWTEPLFMNSYARWSGDVDGLSETPHGYRARCGYEGRFWLSPVCRHNASECIPIMSSQYGWLVDAFMAWSTAYGMPTAIGILDDHTLPLPLLDSVNMLSYWYQPDARASSYDLERLIFPRHSAVEWAAGNKRSAAEGTYIGKLVSRHLESHAYAVMAFLKNMHFELDELQELLERTVAGASQEQVACQWISASRNRWEKWIPKETSCQLGFGLMNTSSYVDSRAVASSCGICPPGSFSSKLVDSDGLTYTCAPCEAGSYSGSSGKSLCQPCSPGRIAATSGQSSCQACKPGSFAAWEGQTSCTTCGASKTTSRQVDGQWVQVESADSGSLCRCPTGTFLAEGVCNPCGLGARCLGDELELLPGYFAFPDDPGSIYRCHRDPWRCPGGAPGSCEEGLEQSLLCGACVAGLRPQDGHCVACGSQDYATVAIIAVVVLLVTGGFHALLLGTDGSGAHVTHVGLMRAGTYVGQLVVCLQLIIIIQRLDIEWRDPFLAILRVLQVISWEDLVQSMNAVLCLTKLSPAGHFLLQALGVPCYFTLGPLLVHLVAAHEQLHVLKATLGSFCLLFFIALCTSLLEPFQCLGHPNGSWSMRSADVLCNLRDDHFILSFTAICLTPLPIGFLAACSWIVLFEYPKRLHRMDAKFIKSCYFLLFRFRPGMEAMAVFLLLRNALVSLAPVLPSSNASFFSVYTMLFGNLCVTLYCTPWRSKSANYMDILANASFLLILFQGAFFINNVDDNVGMITCTLVLCGMLLALTVLAVFALADHVVKRSGKKRYHFFLTHHKEAAGSVARLLKLELQQRGFSCFLDSDDLLDLPQLFFVLSENAKTVLALASPSLLMRKWCLAELITARLQSLDRILILLPNFRFPDLMFIEAVDKVVGDLGELACYGLGHDDLRETLQELQDLRSVKFPENFQQSDIRQLIQQVMGEKVGKSFEGIAPSQSSCLILADQCDMEAVATAHVLRAWMMPLLMHKLNAPPCVLSLFDRIDSVNVRFLVLVCTQGCLETPSLINWIMQSLPRASQCSLLPVVADESFQIPGGQKDFHDLAESPTVQLLSDPHAYLSVIKAIFTRIALRFSTRFSSESILKAKARAIFEQLETSESLGSALRSSRSMDLDIFRGQPLDSRSTQPETERLEQGLESEGVLSLDPMVENTF